MDKTIYVPNFPGMRYVCPFGMALLLLDIKYHT